MSSNKNNEEKRNESSSQTLGNLNRLQAMLQVADENGLFETNNDGCKSIYSDLTDGFGEVNKDAKKAHEKFFSAYNKFNTAINNAGFSWRFIFCYGGHIIIYYTLIIIFLTFLWYFSQTTLNNSTLLWVPTWAFIWGIVGGILQGFWLLWQEINYRRLRKHWFTWFYCLPIMGAILGALVYLVYYTGFIVSTGVNTLTSEVFGMLLSALAGFCSLWAVKLLDSFTRLIQVKNHENP